MLLDAIMLDNEQYDAAHDPNYNYGRHDQDSHALLLWMSYGLVAAHMYDSYRVASVAGP